MLKCFLKSVRKELLKVNPVRSCKKIYFVVDCIGVGSTILRAVIMMQYLQKRGVFADIIDLSLGKKRLKTIRDSILVFIKQSAIDDQEMFDLLKLQNNILVWDPIDGLEDNKEKKCIKHFNAAMMPNQVCIDKYKKYFNDNCLLQIIYHHWDPRCQPNTCNEFHLLYLGDTTPENIKQEYIDTIPELDVHQVRSKKEADEKDIFNLFKEYSCHFSVKAKEHDGFIYKPPVKLATAAATHSNIIISRDPSSLEILDNSYPFFTSGDLKDVIDKVALAKESYGTKLWDEALSHMLDIKERLSLTSITKDYIKLFRRFN